jgi:hypothetical protein
LRDRRRDRRSGRWGGAGRRDFLVACGHQISGQPLELADDREHLAFRLPERRARRCDVRHLLMHQRDELVDPRWNLARVVDANVVLQRKGDRVAAITSGVRRNRGVLWREDRNVAVYQIDLECDRQCVTGRLTTVGRNREVCGPGLVTRDPTELHMTSDKQAVVRRVLQDDDVLRTSVGIRDRRVGRVLSRGTYGIVRVDSRTRASE